ncbi:NAD-dependent epimerase/dehydratase family protein [Acidiferrimicrobium sp. IK]|uniref:NAD-dependent epimerase/dehydratase family protein n=1 Tax=Acidiferrimicrobium sp. IK TaxID=2871700 RepID=UPI0021CAF4BC|nr:NAD-dependent epimerase/dehydratase family protein [Acidiferrimicrobium sp. IK]MCU4185103.1 NAD-dependent epimerase/dehydratase family protein [Acidiferrimicrobium sp. IK]
MDTIVVTGIAGSLGRRVAARLAKAGSAYRVVGVDAREEPSLPATIETHRLDLAATGARGARAVEELTAIVAGADVVVHLAWQTSDVLDGAPDADEHHMAEANRVGLARVLDAVSGSPVRTLVHLSSATVYGAWADNPVPLTEDSALRPNPEFAFAVGKADAERVVADWAVDHPDVAVAVLRPAVTVGSPERPLYLALGGTRVPAAGDGGRPVQYLHVDDLAAAVVVTAEQGLRGVFNVAPDTGIPEGVARSLAGGVAKLTLPARITRPVASWGWRRWRRGVPREARAYTVHPWVIAPDRMKAAGWVPQYTSEEALVATDDRPHFDDLPPGRRQNLTLLAAGASVAGAAAAAVGGVWALRARRRR